MKSKIRRPLFAGYEHLKRLLFCTYSKAMRMISRTGIARSLLPLRVRKGLGQLLRRAVIKVVTIDPARPYDVMGHRMQLDPGSASSRDIVFGMYESDTVEVFKKLVKPGMTVVDVGAHVGFYTLLAARLAGPTGRVYAFEPNPEVFGLLLRNIKENGYEGIVRAVPKAASNSRRTVRLYLSETESGETSFYPDDQVTQDNIEVETVVLDEFFSKEGWPKVHVVKVDVEGAEVEVLQGIKEIVQRNPHLKLIVEFNPNTQVKSLGNHEDIFKIIGSLGFQRGYAVWYGLQEVSIPEDIPRLLKMTEATTNKCINLPCEMRGNNGNRTARFNCNPFFQPGAVHRRDASLGEKPGLP